MAETDTVIAILLDAFSSKYLNPKYCSFLYKISHKGFAPSLESMFAFEGVTASLLTGTTPNTNKIWLDYTFKPEGSIPRFFKHLVKLCDIVPHDDTNKLLRFALHKGFRQSIATPNVIPPNLINFFEPSARRHDVFTEGITTLFEQLDKHGLKYYVTGLFSAFLDRFTTWNFLRKSAEDYSFLMLKLSSLDRLGHKYGPESNEVHNEVIQIDKILEKVLKKLNASKRRFCFIVFSDHGMCPVTYHVNLLNLLDKLPYEMPDDYLLFLSSTAANFLFFNLEAKEKITELLSRTSFGNVLDEDQLAEVGIEKLGKEYGELIFALNEGCVFFPDFYRKVTPPKGMHGYFHSTYDAPILSIYPSDLSATFDTQRVPRHIDIMPTVLDLLDLPIPQTVEGKSLLIKH